MADDDDRFLMAKVPAEEIGPNHWAGWNAALDEALRNASDVFELGDHRVTVQFWAEMEVTNPGTIHNYGVSIIPGG